MPNIARYAVEIEIDNDLTPEVEGGLTTTDLTNIMGTLSGSLLVDEADLHLPVTANNAYRLTLVMAIDTDNVAPEIAPHIYLAVMLDHLLFPWDTVAVTFRTLDRTWAHA